MYGVWDINPARMLRGIVRGTNMCTYATSSAPTKMRGLGSMHSVLRDKTNSSRYDVTLVGRIVIGMIRTSTSTALSSEYSTPNTAVF